MKIITTYVAYDGIEFNNMEECREHEAFAWDMAVQVVENVKFYDSLHDEIPVPYFHTIEEMLNWLEMIFNSDCNFVKIINDIPSSAWSWFTNYFGYDLPEEQGEYKYNWNIFEWEKLVE